MYNELSAKIEPKHFADLVTLAKFRADAQNGYRSDDGSNKGAIIILYWLVHTDRTFRTPNHLPELLHNLLPKMWKGRSPEEEYVRQQTGRKVDAVHQYIPQAVHLDATSVSIEQLNGTVSVAQAHTLTNVELKDLVSAWDYLIRHISKENAIDVLRKAEEKYAFGITDVGDRLTAVRKLRLGDDFALRVHCPLAGRAFAVQQVGLNWFPLRLDVDFWHQDVTGGFIAPRQSSRRKMHFSEHVHAQRHRYVFLICEPDISYIAIKHFKLHQHISLAELDKFAVLLLEKQHIAYHVSHIDIAFT